MPTGMWVYALSFLLTYALYVWINDKKLRRLPPEAKALSPRRWTEKSVRETHERLSRTESVSLLKDDDLPPKTGRRYVVVGGAGFLGGWIVLHLIRRGEDPRRIRVLDLRPPQRKDLLRGPAVNVDFIKVDISNRVAVDEAFQKPWPRLSDDPGPNHQGDPKSDLPEITVFHTAAIIRFFERYQELLHLSQRVNTQGTQNVLDAARRIGASTFVCTSSGSVAINHSRFWLWPWQKEPKKFTQIVTDDDGILPKCHEEFFSNYAVTKMEAERLVRAADKTKANNAGRGELRTGCIRPGNGIYGSGGDILIDKMVKDKVHPSWVPGMLQSFIHAENCSLAHLCYEQRLIELQSEGSGNPDIGGQAFNVTDRGPPCVYKDVYDAVKVLAGHDMSFIYLSPTFMLTISHFVEWYHVAQHRLSQARRRRLQQQPNQKRQHTSPLELAKTLLLTKLPLLPRITSDLVFLQPSIFALTQIHLIFDDSRARLPPRQGGLGYQGPITTLEGTCKTVLEHMRDLEREKAEEGREDEEGGRGRGSGSKTIKRVYGDPDEDGLDGVGGFDPMAPEMAVGEVMEKIGNGLKLDAMKTAN